MSEEKKNGADPVYLRARLRLLIREFLSKSDREPDPRRRLAILHEAADLSKRLREHKGISKWVPVWCAGLAAIAGLAFAFSRTGKSFYYVYPSNYLRVVENIDPCLGDGSCGYRFAVQNVQNGVPGDVTEVHFCKSLQPRFEAGMSLQWIRYTQAGSCLEIDGYDVVRGEGHLPKLADNCNPDYTQAKEAGHIRCEGGKARF